jgi:molecular chaperone HtpG
MTQAAEKIDNDDSNANANTNNSQKHHFNADVSNVLHLMIHALYTNRDIFLRELISNASDACDKLRFEALSNPDLTAEQGALGIIIRFDKKQKTLEIEDNGIGMNEADLIANLGTVARSGTQEFLKQAAKQAKDGKASAELIGQFGVGFYSAFMVADSIRVHTRKAGEEQAWMWESDGSDGYSLHKADARVCGTSIMLSLKEEALEYLDTHRLSHIIKTYSDHVSFPITLVDEEGKDRLVNDASAIWARPKQDITDAQYEEFYHHVAQSPEAPWMVMHNKNEGALEFTNLLFVPGMKPFDLFHPERHKRVKLYVKRVFITDEGIDVIPAYLRFLRGVIDSADLPLNISRETLQGNAMIDKIRAKVTSKFLGELKKSSAKDPENYQKFWDNFGSVLKEGLCEATEPREKILDACRFHSTHDTEQTISLSDYIARMKEDQQGIYYLVGDSLAALRNSPQLEGFKSRGIEVLLLVDHVDDFWLNVTPSYQDKPFKSVIKAGAEFENTAEESDEDNAQTPEAKADMTALIEAMKTLFGEDLRDVRITKKLSNSPCCLAIGEGDMDIRMERFMREHNQLPKSMPKILEINPTHALVTQLANSLKAQGDMQDDLADKCWLLLDQARLIEGEPVSDMSAFITRLNAQILAA